MSGCNELESENIKADENRFVGTWKTTITTQLGGSYNETIVFFSDGTCNNFPETMGRVSGTYRIKDGLLVFTTSPNQIWATYDYAFSENYTTLTISNIGTENSIILRKTGH